MSSTSVFYCENDYRWPTKKNKKNKTKLLRLREDGQSEQRRCSTCHSVKTCTRTSVSDSFMTVSSLHVAQRHIWVWENSNFTCQTSTCTNIVNNSKAERILLAVACLVFVMLRIHQDVSHQTWVGWKIDLRENLSGWHNSQGYRQN